LEKLFIKSNAFNSLPVKKSQDLWDTLQTTTNQPLLKINLYYDTAWWGNGISGQPSVEFGPNFADFPTGSVYPFYSISDEVVAGLEYQENVDNPPKDIQVKLDKISNSKYNKAAALTIYCDFMNINYWSGLQSNGELFNSPMQEQYNNHDPQTVFPASQAIVREATKYFEQIFNTHYVPKPVMTSARIWEGSVEFDLKPSQQFGYGVHQWAIGADDRQVMKDLVEPMKNLYTCGEAFSDYQGWVEGALRSTDLVMQQGFGLLPFNEVYQRRNGIASSAAIKAAYQKSTTQLIREYIAPDYSPKNELSSSGCRQSNSSCIGVKLSYFDKS